MHVRSDNEEFMSGDYTNEINFLVLTFYIMILTKRVYIEAVLI